MRQLKGQKDRRESQKTIPFKIPREKTIELLSVIDYIYYMTLKVYSVVIEKKALKELSKLPLKIQKKLSLLLKDLRDKGPIQPSWPNYSKLSSGKYHCHLDYSWVACWKNEKGTLIIEVYYVGSREKAPY